MVVHKGAVVLKVNSVYGSQQGDPLGGHFFALSMYDFMLRLATKFPEACISWIVDDLTVSDKQGRLLEVAEFIRSVGPEYGLFKNDTKGEIYSPEATRVPQWRPHERFIRGFGYSHAVSGFDKLLGAPLGEEELERRQAVVIVGALLQPAKQLKRIQEAQLEFVLLKYCVCTVSMHLCRLLEPHVLHEALQCHEEVIKSQLERIMAFYGQAIRLSNSDWEWAKLPVRNNGGMGLHDLPLIKEAAYMAAMGAVARRATAVHIDTGSIAAHKVRAWFDDSNDGFEEALAKLADKVNTGDAPHPVCPSLAALETMPGQSKLAEELYKQKRIDLMAEPMTRQDRAWKRSRCQFGAGEWLNSIPMLKRFKCKSLVFKVMLHVWLGVLMSIAEGIGSCVGCGEVADRSRALLNGRHFMTKCHKGRRIAIHDRVRDVICQMYKSLNVGAEIEVGGLYAVLRSNGEYRPADVLVPVSGSNRDRALALDVTITDPTTRSSLEKECDVFALRAAEQAHRKKMQVHERHERLVAPTRLPFYKVPLAFETTGAMGKATQSWWQSVRELEADRRGMGETTSRMQLGLEHTWSANNFATFWLQSISMAHAREQADSILLWVNKCQSCNGSVGWVDTADFGSH